MKSPILVVTNPPHDEVDLDAASTLIGLDVFQTRLKFIFSAPEVLTASDRASAEGVAESFRSAGVSVATFDGLELWAIPWPEPVSSFEFTGTGLVARLPDRELELTYDSNVVGVYCKPPAGFRTKSTQPTVSPDDDGMDIVNAIEWMANLDLYFVRDGSLQRISIIEDLTDFSGLGPMRRRTVAEDMEETAAGCNRRFSKMVLDTRLENVRPRRRFVGGDAAVNPELRERYSFGTLLLKGMLASISPELADLTQYELGSRLGYVTSRGQTNGA
ncbi:MAG: hypothetical protein OEN56_13390 [Gemmatimonadota bacterium]|nr:hypothetical protein [Gemmatimonadota bacterium]